MNYGARLLLGILALALTAACAQKSVTPGAAWESFAAIEDAGFSGEEFRTFDAAVRDANTQSMMVIRSGRAAYAYGDVTGEEPAYIASVRKSVLSMLMDEYIRSGVIDLDATLSSMEIDDVGGLSAVEKNATLRDLISARSGIYHPASNSSGVTEEDPTRGEHAPGEFYWYNNWDFNAAGGIFESVTGKNIYKAFARQLAAPLQMQDFDLAAHLENGKTGDLERSRFPAYHFFISTRDLARIGLLMLREGRWHGEQILGADWVRESTSLVTPNDEMNPERFRESGFGYGYMWWVFDPAHFPEEFHGGYAARGHFGQYIVVLPALDLVIAHKTSPVEYESPEEYEAINVTWNEMRGLIDLLLAAME